jgi:RNA-directed DNA polymerase
MEQQPASVPLAKQAGEADLPARWSWVEPSVWTERMLTALEQGVKGGVWFSLIDKVYKRANLRSAATQVIANHGAAGVDQVSVKQFQAGLEVELDKLQEALTAGTYEPQAIRRVYIPKPGSREQRPLGIPTVRDRTVQGALRHVLEPLFEKEFAQHSYGFRPQRGCKDALRRVDELLRTGYGYVVDADLQSYFDTIPHDRLLERLRERVADQRVLSLVAAFLKAGIFNGQEEVEAEAGAPQGAVLSPLLSNIYLNPLDHLMVNGGYQMVRYADDFVVCCRSQAEAEQALAVLRQWGEAEGLTLHPTKTRLVEVRTEGFDFLGYHFVTTRAGKLERWPRKKSLAKLRTTVREQTKRTDGRALSVILQQLNQILRGWFHYFKHSKANTFAPVDGWIRKRLRSILRKRAGRTGAGRGADHQRWPNAYFTTLGYYELETAYAEYRQPPRG